MAEPAASRPRRPTVSDIARAAGVSPSTVSRALHGTGYAAPAVRIRVREVAQRIGYVPDANARTLRSRSSRSVGVLISDLRNPFYADLAAGIEGRLRSAGYSMILVNDDGRADAENDAVRMFAALRVAGIIMTPVSRRAVERARGDGMTVVQADRAASRRADAVVGDNTLGAAQVTRHLLDHGHRAIALLIDETAWDSGADRLTGYRAALEEAEVPVVDDLVARATFDLREATTQVCRLLDRHPEVTAVFAANNVLAQVALAELHRRTLAVPAEISLVAYDDVPWMDLVTPKITAVSQHTVDLGRVAADLLLQRLATPTIRPRLVRVAPQLNVRGSSGPVRPVRPVRLTSTRRRRAPERLTSV